MGFEWHWKDYEDLPDSNYNDKKWQVIEISEVNSETTYKVEVTYDGQVGNTGYFINKDDGLHIYSGDNLEYETFYKYPVNAGEIYPAGFKNGEITDSLKVKSTSENITTPSGKV